MPPMTAGASMIGSALSGRISPSKHRFCALFQSRASILDCHWNRGSIGQR
ncbi:hypothetical protein SZ00_06052 (plasmid) [Rhodococcus sp. AD45]|nr:hypothetical protein SZ00_06052 [Rhodococcus sp. AD45]